MDRLITTEDYWKAYTAQLPPGHKHLSAIVPSAWGFGDGPEMADELGGLVAAGIKTATCSSVWELEYDGDPIPHPGDLSIILNGSGQPICIIETTGVEVKPFNQVTEDFTYDEGEGDRSYTYWRQAHEHFFTRSCARIGCSFKDNMPVVCERFQLIWKE